MSNLYILAITSLLFNQILSSPAQQQSRHQQRVADSVSQPSHQLIQEIQQNYVPQEESHYIYPPLQEQQNTQNYNLQWTNGQELSSSSGTGHSFGGSYETSPSQHESGGSSNSDKNYVSSAELTSLAHSSAQQAKTAVQSQHTAGSQAAFGAKNSLAQAALGAAATAQAALVGKQVIVQSLKQQLQEAEKQLKAEISQYHQTEQSAKAAQETAQQSQQQVKTLTAALAASQGGASRATKAAQEAASAAAAQHSMIQDAKHRVNHLTQQLHHALQELKETEASAHKAAAAAQVAQSNAAAAANAVAISASQAEHQQEYHKKK